MRTSPIVRPPPAFASLKSRLERYGLAGSVTLCSWTAEPLQAEAMVGCVSLDVACAADLLLNLAYDIPLQAVERFRRSALVAVDPGFAPVWFSEGSVSVAPRHKYSTSGETFGQPGARFS